MRWDRTFLLPLLLSLVFGACAKQRGESKRTDPTQISTQTPKPLSQIDLSKIGHLEPKGRVQDKDYQNIEIIDDLIAHRKDSIPFLISKLDDATVIHDHVMDYWPEVTVGDVAFFILSDFTLDSTWTKQTVPGTNAAEIFEAKADPNTPAWEYYEAQIRKHGRRFVKAKWQEIWNKYKDRIVWDDKERCFKVT
jgi:hypothetical protein